jgi:hypothetical protein
LCKDVSVFQVLVPNFLDNVTEKYGHALLGRLITGIVIELGFIGSLCTNVSNHCGIVGNQLVIEWETSQAYKLGTMAGFVLDSLGEDGCEGVNPVQLVVGDDHKKEGKGLPDGKQVIAGQLPFEGGEGVMGLFEEVSGRVGHDFG